MEIHQLRHMLAAAEHTSYAQAAKSCFTSRQNIAHSIKALESELGIVLFERRGNEMLLTPAGRQLASEAGEIVARVDGLHVAFANSGVSDAVLNLAVSTNEFIAQHADRLRIAEASCADCYRFVCSGKADVAVIMCMERKFSECDVLEIGESVSFALMSSSSPLACKEGLAAVDLKDHKLLLMSEPAFQYEPLFAQLDALGFDRANVSVIPSTSSMIHVVKRRGGTGIVSDKFSVAPPEGFCAIPLSDSRLNWRFYILFKKSAPGFPAVAKFAQGVRGTF